MYEVCLHVCGCECVHAKARGTLCLTSFRQSLLLNPELGWPLSPNHLPVSIQLRAGCICPRSQVTCFTGDGDCTPTSGFHSRVFDCWATTPAPRHSSTTTYLIGVLFLFLRQCLTMFHCLLWWPGWSGILLFLIFYKQPEGKLAQHSECTCAPAICPATRGHLYHDVRSGRGS